MASFDIQTRHSSAVRSLSANQLAAFWWPPRRGRFGRSAALQSIVGTVACAPTTLDMFARTT